MLVRNKERREREIFVGLTKAELEDLIVGAAAKELGMTPALLRKHAKVDILPNMEGSPEYKSGYKANVRANIPSAALDDATGQPAVV